MSSSQKSPSMDDTKESIDSLNKAHNYFDKNNFVDCIRECRELIYRGPPRKLLIKCHILLSYARLHSGCIEEAQCVRLKAEGHWADLRGTLPKGADYALDQDLANLLTCINNLAGDLKRAASG